MTMTRRFLCRIDSPSTDRIIRHLSGFQKAPQPPKGGETRLAKRSAPKVQLGYEKPETGILEVETGRIVAGRKEIKIIESDEAYQSRMAELEGLHRFKAFQTLTPVFLIILSIFAYIYWFDQRTQPHERFIRKWKRENEK